MTSVVCGRAPVANTSDWHTCGGRPGLA